MKKIISITLLLAMILCIFAGCSEGQNESGDNPLESAVAYLKNMYDKSTKDEDNKLTADKELLPSVTIDGVSYPVTWTIEVTAGPADCIVIADGTSAGSQKIDIVTQPEEEVRFTLVGTISDANGNTNTVKIKFYSPAVQKVDVNEGQEVVFCLPSDSKYITGTEYIYTSSSSGKSKAELVLSDNKADAIALTVQNNTDGTVSFVAEGKYLFCDGTDVKFASTQDDYTKFVLEATGTDNQYFIKCAVAVYGDKPQYLEVYSGYLTCYSMYDDSDVNIYTFEMQDATGANGKLTAADTSTPSESTTPSTPSTDVSTTGKTPAEIIDAAYALGVGEALSGEVSLTGVITSVDTAWSDQYSNITVTIKVAGRESKPIQCFRMKGDGAKDLKVGDTITCTGTLKNYNGTIEFDAGCKVSNIVAGSGSSSSSSSSSNSSTTTVDGKLAASIDMKGTTTRTSYSTEQTVHSANGITFTNDKSSNTNGNVDMTKYEGYGYRAYKGSTVKVEYTGMTAIVFHLDDFSSGKYLTGLDDMTVSGATITRNGSDVTITFASATNVFQSLDVSAQIRINSIDVYTAK